MSLFFSIVYSALLFSQTENFEIQLEPVQSKSIGGIQSFAFGQHHGLWLIVGGRLDGLHRRQPWAAFDIQGNNNQLIVLNPETGESWSAKLNGLSPALQEQLSSTNMQFYQEGTTLYCIGGYGYSPTIGDHTTFSSLTAIDVPGVIHAIQSNQSFAGLIRQVRDSKFQVTGGKLKKIKGKYYLLGGQKFIGMYNPMGPTHGPGFIQEYTNAIRVFELQDDGSQVKITHIKEHIDTENLHRRDYNAEAQILPNGEEGITMFSGVFQHTVDLPFLNAVTVQENSFKVEPNFRQYYNHYHCPVIPLYSSKTNEMHTLFFGGIAQFYDQSGTLVQDNNVPFVKTIARVTRDSKGNLAEYKLRSQMPTLLGAGAEFIPIDSIAHYDNGVIRWDELIGDTITLGHIFGGISSTAQNIFFLNDGSQSTASNNLFKVKLIKTKSVSTHFLNPQSKTNYPLHIIPNPNNGEFILSYSLPHRTDVEITIFNSNGNKVYSSQHKNLDRGEHYLNLEKYFAADGNYLIQINLNGETLIQKMIVER